MTPMKVKIFREFSKSIHPPTELQINTWLEENPDIEVVHLLQSESMTPVSENEVERNLTVTVFYR
ncbi:MAG TPA: hypothetical protein ACFCUC_10150 [Desulfobacterales bacterium]